MISSAFSYSSQGRFSCEGVDVWRIIEKVGTPVYIYSASGIRRQAGLLMDGLHPRCSPKYAIKANSNLEIVGLLSKCGYGAEVVSLGELAVCIQARVDPSTILLGGIGKSKKEFDIAIREGVGMVSLDSEVEVGFALDSLRTAQGRVPQFLVRCNPNVDSGTHPYLTTGKEENKFGIDAHGILRHYPAWQASSKGAISGLHFHVGSQITEVGVFKELFEVVASTVKALREGGASVTTVDVGGGIGVSYEDNYDIDIGSYKALVAQLLDELDVNGIVEPGRFLLAESGVAVGQVLDYKEARSKDFLITDLALNDLVRPALYGAYHEIIPVLRSERDFAGRRVDVVGPVCESGDFLGRNRRLPRMYRGDAIAVLTAGAYGYSMASNYNCRPKPAEVLVDGSGFEIIRERQSMHEFFDVSEEPRAIESLASAM